MPRIAHALLSKLHSVNPYENFDHTRYPLDLQGGGLHPIYATVLGAIEPRLIIEVGSWKGSTALAMASWLKNRNCDGAVICIDTWLGSIDHLQNAGAWDIKPFMKNGYPTLYYQFLANVIHRQCQDYIVPFPNTSITAARWLIQQNIQADCIYIDGSHEEDDVYQDLVYYWRLLKPGGVMFGDDWHACWYGVICAVNRFAKEHDLKIQTSDVKWVLHKVPSKSQLEMVAPLVQRIEDLATQVNRVSAQQAALEPLAAI